MNRPVGLRKPGRRCSRRSNPGPTISDPRPAGHAQLRGSATWNAMLAQLRAQGSGRGYRDARTWTVVGRIRLGYRSARAIGLESWHADADCVFTQAASLASGSERLSHRLDTPHAADHGLRRVRSNMKGLVSQPSSAGRGLPQGTFQLVDLRAGGHAGAHQAALERGDGAGVDVEAHRRLHHVEEPVRRGNLEACTNGRGTQVLDGIGRHPGLGGGLVHQFPVPADRADVRITLRRRGPERLLDDQPSPGPEHCRRSCGASAPDRPGA